MNFHSKYQLLVFGVKYMQNALFVVHVECFKQQKFTGHEILETYMYLSIMGSQPNIQLYIAVVPKATENNRAY